MNQKRENLAGWAFAAPALVIFITLVFIPVFASFALAFCDWDFLSGLEGIEWVGLKNFVRIFTRDRKFTKALGNTFLYAFTTVPVTIIFSLVIAYMLNTKVYMKKFLRMCFFVPYISSMVALAAVFKFLFSDLGPVNQVLGIWGVDPIKWITDPKLARIPVIILQIYAGVGFCLIVYMAALQNVPRDLYEAAELDGANQMTVFLKVTLPLISPTTFYLIIVRLIEAFKIFTSVNIINYGGNTNSIVRNVFTSAFVEYKFGYASAYAWVLVAIILVITFIQLWGQKKWVHY